MYDPREDLFERDEDDSHLIDQNDTLRPGVRENPRASGLSYSALARSIFEDSNDEIYFPSYEDDSSDNSNDSSDDQNSMEYQLGTISAVARVAPIERSEDDSASGIQPSRNVDYLNHEWVEEDLWSSWKYIVSKRKVYSNSQRLENASWRTWEQKRRNLKTVSPETVRWLKDHDVTWLYGPLQPSLCASNSTCNSPLGCPPSDRYPACQNRKPILKKWRFSELMLRRSVSSATLLKQAATTSEVQKDEDLPAETSNTFINIAANTTALESLGAFNNSSPISDQESWIPKSVRFHDLVEQCVAISDLGEDEIEYHYVGDVDDEVIMTLKPKQYSKQGLSKVTVATTIERLPHAVLKRPLETEQETSANCGLGLGIANMVRSRPTSSISQVNLESGIEEDEYLESPSSRKDSVQMFHDKLEAIRMQTVTRSLPHSFLLERRDSAAVAVSHGTQDPPIEGRDARILSEFLPCRSQLASFSLTPISESVYPSEEDEKVWSMSPGTLAEDVFSSAFALDPIFKDVSFDNTRESWSPRTSSDSGYGSEERNEEWRVKDTSNDREEKEKGVSDWDLYPDAWDEDEVDEALAWERGF